MAWEFRFLVPEVLAGAPRPPGGNLALVLPQLRAANIGAVVNVHEHPLLLPSVNTLDVMHDSTPDYHAPRHLLEICTFIEAVRARGVATVAICECGHGRTGTVLAAWLIFSRRISAQDAITEVRASYYHAAVESSAQVHALEAIAVQLVVGA